MFIDFLIYTLAAVGFICILRAVYDILLSGVLCAKDCAELYLVLDGQSPRAEHLLRSADRARRTCLPGMPIVFVDTGEGCGSLCRLAEELEISYFPSGGCAP